MKKILFIIAIFFSLKSYSQNITVAGYDSTNGHEGKKYVLKPTYTQWPATNPNDTTVGYDLTVLDSLLHLFIDTGSALRNNVTLVYDSVNRKWVAGVGAGVDTSLLLHKAGTETITGNKTISNYLDMGGAYAYRINGNNGMSNPTTGTWFFGESGNNTVTGQNNLSGGYQSLLSVSSGGNNTNWGAFGLRSTTTGINNTNTGYYGLYSNTTGGYNSNYGFQGLRLGTTPSYNDNSGYQGLYHSSGLYNTNSGSNGLWSIASNGYATNNGAYGLYSNTAAENTNLGAYGLYSSVTGTGNVNGGAYGLYTTTGYGNTNFGSHGQQFANTGNGNTTVGDSVLVKLNYDISNGNGQPITSLISGNTYKINTVGTSNFTLVGASANTVGTTFTATGTGTGSGTVVSYGGSNNTVIGYKTAAFIYEASSNTIIGANISGLTNGLSKNIILSDGDGNIRIRTTSIGVTSFFKGADVASASAITPTGNLFHVTGTTTITSITATNVIAGATIKIIFDGVLTFTDGSNLKLAGDFVTTADDTITLTYDGTNFYETGRSVN